ncbi:hypothetical protein HYN48_08095 [Flavobacterium magnum]|uniref:Uncharacterized protein n=1 Tax=Flavobacterium magnum TaxID=2162713 RepID=A0A2S0RE58_9FLAO|nr:hypothetical protein HYN48_08095 [Flavobacterium magnum]
MRLQLQREAAALTLQPEVHHLLTRGLTRQVHPEAAVHQAEATAVAAVAAEAAVVVVAEEDNQQ